MTIPEISGALTLVGMIAAGTWFLDDRHASQTEFIELAGSYRTFALEQRLANYRARLWTLQEKFGKDCGPARSECRALEIEIAQLIRKLAKR